MPDPKKTSSVVRPLLVAAVAAVALLLTLVGIPGSTDSQEGPTPALADREPSTSAPSADPLTRVARRQQGDPMAKGDVSAPVVLVVFSEFQCPFCGKFARDTAPTLEEKYVADGTLRIEWRDFPYLGPESTTAALAGRAAADQGRFWEFHDAMYADQLPPNSGKLDEEHVTTVAEDIGLDVAEFRSDLTSDRARKSVEADFREGQSLGVTGTPSFVINGTPVVGAQPTEVFEQVIGRAARGS